MTTQLVSALDNGGETFDRYTLCFEQDGAYFVYGASENPTHPQGFGQFVGEYYLPDSDENPDIGFPIAFDDLPEGVKKLVRIIEAE